VIGKLGPTRIPGFHSRADGSQTLILDDNSGGKDGFALPNGSAPRQLSCLRKYLDRKVPNIAQEDWLMDATTKDRAAAFSKKRQAVCPVVLEPRYRT